jgi:hypothetical protein
MDKPKSISTIEEITLGENPPELTIKFSEPIQSVDLNKIVLRDIKVPGVVQGLKLSST